MQITINGDRRDVPAGCSVTALLDQFRLNSNQIAVEVNRQLVPRTQHADHILCDGDRVEVVALTGGG